MSDFDERDLLVRELHDRSQEVGGRPIGLDAVRRSAGRIRRRRQVVGGAVAAVALGVAVPTGLAVTGSLSAGPGPAEPPVANRPTTSPSPSEEPAPTPRPDGSFVLTTRDLPRGTDPGLPYVLAEGPSLVTPQETFDLPKAYSQVARVNGGWMAVDGGANGFELVTLTPQMEARDSQPGGPLTVDRRGSRILYVLRDGENAGDRQVVDAPIQETDQKDAVTWQAPSNSDVTPVGYLDEDTVVFRTEGEQPRVFLGQAGGTTTELSPFLGASSASEANGLVAGLVSYSNGKQCSGVMDPRSGTELRWRTCDYSLHQFSPDGRFIIAGAAYYDAWGSPTLSVLDAHTGDPLVEFRPGKDVPLGVAQTAWEDDDTVLATLVEGNEVTMVRVELSGALEAATDTYGAVDMTYPFWFAGQPR